MGISIDGTFAIQIVSFVALWVCLKRLLFDPVLQVLHEREERTRGNLSLAEQVTGEATTLQHQYEERLRSVRHAVAGQSEEQRKIALADERAVITAARDAASAELSRTRSEIAALVEAARATLRGEAAELATRAAEQVLGRAVA